MRIFPSPKNCIMRGPGVLCFVLLGAKSIERFRKIESASGVDFYQEVGFLSIAPKFENEEFFKAKKSNDLLKPF